MECYTEFLRRTKTNDGEVHSTVSWFKRNNEIIFKERIKTFQLPTLQYYCNGFHRKSIKLSVHSYKFLTITPILNAIKYFFFFIYYLKAIQRNILQLFTFTFTFIWGFKQKKKYCLFLLNHLKLCVCRRSEWKDNLLKRFFKSFFNQFFFYMKEI